jgi:aspartate/methionine/tyrosine aminotransferase
MTKLLPRVRAARPMESVYLEWSKAHGKVKYNLASSGVVPCDVKVLSPSRADFTMIADNEYGWQPLLDRIAKRYDVSAEHVVLAHGTSMANHLACAALLAPGDEVLLERPAYDPLRAVPEYLQCEVREFERRAEDGYRLDIDLIERAVTPRTRLVIISNLHNPTGALTTRAELERLAALANTHNLHVLADEVYLEWLYGVSEEPRSAINLSPRFVTTRSLTKVFGLAALRAGWILAEPALATRMKRLNGLFTASMSHPAERLAARALEYAAQLLESQRKRVDGNRKLATEFVEGHPKLSWVRPEAGTVGWVRLSDGSVETLVDRLLEQDTLVAPGRFFGVKNHFRIGFGMDTAVLEEGLRRLGSALD